jgi:hypothetical protein
LDLQNPKKVKILQKTERIKFKIREVMKMSKEKASVEDIAFRLSLPCNATEDCKGRLEETIPGKMITDKKKLTTVKIKLQSRIRRCPVCLKLNRPELIEIAWNG